MWDSGKPDPTCLSSFLKCYNILQHFRWNVKYFINGVIRSAWNVRFDYHTIMGDIDVQLLTVIEYMFCAIWLGSACNFTKRNNPSWLFFTFSNLCKWYEIAQSVSYEWPYFRLTYWKHLKAIRSYPLDTVPKLKVHKTLTSSRPEVRCKKKCS